MYQRYLYFSKNKEVVEVVARERKTKTKTNTHMFPQNQFVDCGLTHDRSPPAAVYANNSLKHMFLSGKEFYC